MAVGMQSDNDNLSRAVEPIAAPLDERIQPSKDPSIRPADVLCGRGRTSYNHVGNQFFRETITAAIPGYVRAENRFEKSLVVHGIVDKIRSRGGRFLKKDSKTNQWFELSEQQSKEKVGHAVRDAASSYEAKEKRRGSLGASSERAKAKTKAIGRTLSDSEISSDGALEYRQRPLPTLSSVAEVPLVASLPAAGMGLDLSQQQEQHHRFQYDYPLQQLRHDPHPGLLPHPGHHLDHHQVLPHGINPLPVSSLEHSEQLPLHLQPGMPSSAPQQLYSQPSVREGPVEEHVALGFMQHGHHYHQQQPPYAPPGQEEKEPGHHDEHFLEQINDVLGPLPPGAEDPMSPYFRYRRRPR